MSCKLFTIRQFTFVKQNKKNMIMLKIYDTFHSVTCEDGILLVSTKSTDYPFIIVKNDRIGFTIHHEREINYDVRFTKNINSLDLESMVLYMGDIGEHTHWVLAIPYLGKTVDPNSLYAFNSLDVSKKFSKTDFPINWQSFGSLAIVAGYPE